MNQCVKFAIEYLEIRYRNRALVQMTFNRKWQMGNQTVT